jgi:hypothetical protein
MKNILINDLDYVVFYAEKLLENNYFFRQQKMLIEGQITASKSIFKNKFKDRNFKDKAREYLKEINILR